MPEAPPDRVGRYNLIRAIGSGGMGVVYEAEQEQPRRRVALKLLRSGLLTRDSVRRFEYESQVLGRLQHPGIAQIYEAGMHREGGAMLPYFAMEFVPEALTICEYARERGLTTDARLRLFIQVCDAVHHGHTKGVIHRDIKPANILVGSDGVPKVIDFGVARAIDRDAALATMATSMGQLIGTLEYMSPEQVAGNPEDLDTRSDVYALGVMLHILLAGVMPYEISRTNIAEAMRIIRDRTPVRLSAIDPGLRGDAETIVLKALEKDRLRRYQTALELAEDIRRLLGSRPILARPPSAIYQWRMFARRHTVGVASAAALLIVLLLGVVGTSWGLVRARQEQASADSLRVRAESARAEAERQARNTVAINTFMKDLIMQASPGRAMGRGVTVKDAVDREAGSIGMKYSKTPEVEAAIRATVGVLYASLAEYRLAEEHIREGLELRRRVFGDAHPDTISSKLDLASLCVDTARFSEAELLQRESIEALRAQRLTANEDYVRAMAGLGWTLYNLGRYAESEPVYRETVEVSVAVLGTDSPQTARATSALGMVLAEQGKLEEAEPWVSRGVLESTRLLGPKHTFTLYARNVQCWVTSKLGRHEQSVALQRSQIADATQVYQPDHPHLMYWTQALGWRLVAGAQDAEAERVFRESLDRHRRVLGPDHANTLEVMTGLCRALLDQGRYEEALSIAEECRTKASAGVGIRTPAWMASTEQVAEALRALGKIDEADRLTAELASQP